VVFCRRYADAERYVGLDVTEEDRGDECGERDGEWSVQGVVVSASKILSCDEERWSLGVEAGICGSEVVVNILS
jgi:hypothetical protein